jgi:hypothetical protein
VELVALLFAVGLAVKFWPVIAGIIGLLAAGYWSRLAVDRRFARATAERRRLAEIVERADRQHNWVMQGDPRGTYGDSAAT